MKKMIVILVMLLAGLLAGCGGNRGELYETIAEQAALIDELQQTIIEQSALQQEQLDTIARLQSEIRARAENENNMLPSGLTEAEIREDFFQNAEALVRSAVGEVYHSGPLREEDVILIISRDIGNTVFVQMHRAQGNIVVVLSYRRNWDVREINWRVTGYGTLFFRAPFEDRRDSLTYIIAPREPAEPRHLTDLETVTLPFSWGLGLESTEEVVQGANLWEEAIRLTRLHHGMQVRDIWYEGTILYVEMMPIHVNSFNGGIGSILHGVSVRETFSAFPNATEVRFLVLGRRFTVGYHGFDINCVPHCAAWGTSLASGYETPSHTCIW